MTVEFAAGAGTGRGWECGMGMGWVFGGMRGCLGTRRVLATVATACVCARLGVRAPIGFASKGGGRGQGTGMGWGERVVQAHAREWVWMRVWGRCDDACIVIVVVVDEGVGPWGRPVGAPG